MHFNATGPLYARGRVALGRCAAHWRQWWLSLTGCGEYAGNHRVKITELPVAGSFMTCRAVCLKYLGHGPDEGMTYDAITELPAPGRTGARGEGNVGEIGRSSHANDGPPRRRKGYDAPDRRLVRPETGWPGHETELRSLRYRAVRWLHSRGSPDGKSKERTLGEFWNLESTGRSKRTRRAQVDPLPSSLPCWDALAFLQGAGEWFVRDIRRGLRC